MEGQAFDGMAGYSEARTGVVGIALRCSREVSREMGRRMEVGSDWTSSIRSRFSGRSALHRAYTAEARRPYGQTAGTTALFGARQY